MRWRRTRRLLRIAGLVGLVGAATAATGIPAAGAPGASDGGSGQSAKGPITGLHLTVSTSPDRIEIVYSEPLRRPITGSRLRELNPKEFANLSPDHPRQLLALYDAKGRPIRVFALPADGLAFYDEGLNDHELSLKGKVFHPRSGFRTVDLPLDPSTAFLALTTSRAVLKQATDRGLSPCELNRCFRCDYPPEPPEPPRRLLDTLAIYPLVSKSALDKRGDWRLFDEPGPGYPRVSVNPECFRHPLFKELTYQGSCPLGPGVLHSTSLLHGNGDTAKHYDIVIMGDGFTEEDFPLLDNYANKVKDAILGNPPFADLASKINVHLVRTVSPESHVTNCPNAGLRKTYFNVQGNWPDEYGESPMGYFGTYFHCRIKQAAGVVGALSELELMVMLVNCDVYGGNADPWDQLAYLPVYNSDKFESLALHEMAHSIAWLGEEYVGCAKPDPNYPYPEYHPNVVPEALKDDAWWKGLLSEGEKDPDTGGFRAISTCSDNYDCVSCTPGLSVPGATPDMLGLYWGAMYGVASGYANQCNVTCGYDTTNTTGPPECPISTPYGAVIGTADCNYYRPANNCRMRKLSQPFCRACQEKLCQAVQQVDPNSISCKLSP